MQSIRYGSEECRIREGKHSHNLQKNRTIRSSAAMPIHFGTGGANVLDISILNKLIQTF